MAGDHFGCGALGFYHQFINFIAHLKCGKRLSPSHLMQKKGIYSRFLKDVKSRCVGTEVGRHCGGSAG